MVEAVSKDPTLEAFFRQHFVKDVPNPQTILSRPNPPTYRSGTTNPSRQSLLNLVFEAMGSTSNPDDFVLCEGSINSYKKEIWSYRAPMAVAVYNLAVKEAMTGSVPSADFLTGIRNVRFAVIAVICNTLLTHSLDVRCLQLHELT